MHVLLATPYYPPDLSGAGRYAAHIAAAAADGGHRVTVLHLGGEGERRALTSGIIIEPVRGGRRGMTSVETVRRALALHRSEPIDIAISAIAHPTGAAIAVISRRTKARMVVVALSEELAQASRSKLTSYIVKFTLSTADQVIVVSSWAKQNIVRLGARPDTCSVIPPALDATPFITATDPARRAQARDRFGLDGRVVLTVARLEERKGHDTVLRAIAALGPEFADVRYFVVGEGDQSPLHELATSRGLDSRLTIVNRLTKSELIDAYAAADLFAMVSRPGPIGEVEGFGIVYLEAAASGLACIAGDAGGCADAVEDRSTGLLVNPFDPSSVAAGLRELLSDPEYARRLGHEGRARVCKRFTTARFESDVRDVLRAATTRPRH